MLGPVTVPCSVSSTCSGHSPPQHVFVWASPMTGRFSVSVRFRDASREAMAELNLARNAIPRRAFTAIIRGD